MPDIDEMNDLEHLKSELIGVKEEVHDLINKVDQVYSALVGSDIAKDGGMVERVQVLEDRANSLEDKIEGIEQRSFKSQFYQRIIWGLLGFITSGILTFIIDKFAKK